MSRSDDARWMAAAIALSQRTRGQTAPSPNVGCVIIAGGRLVGRGWTRPGGRPHAEAIALAEAGSAAQGATAYVTLEPCAHVSSRGPTCANLLIEAGITRLVYALRDPDPRTDGKGAALLTAAGMTVEHGIGAPEARQAMAGFLMRAGQGRPHVTLKLATSLDGAIAMADGSSRWITGEAARRHAHVERSRHEMIIVGRGTYDADAPTLDVRIEGLEARRPRRALLSRSAAPPPGWEQLPSPQAIAALDGVDHLLVEGGAGAAAAFIAAGLVDRLLIYRAPILLGAAKPALSDIGLASINAAHGRWRLTDSRMLGSDRFEAYESVHDRDQAAGD